jgi:hypothetical protein
MIRIPRDRPTRARLPGVRLGTKEREPRLQAFRDIQIPVEPFLTVA